MTRSHVRVTMGTLDWRDGPTSAVTVLALLAAPDARMDAGAGVTQTVLLTDKALAASPGLLTLELVTIPGGERLAFPEAPILTVAAGLDPRQAMYLSGRMEGGMTNRSSVPVEAYVLSIAPAD